MSRIEPFSADGIVLRTYPYGEADLIARIVTADHGKLSVLARGARKSRRRFACSLDLLDRGRFEVRSGSGALPLVQAFTPGRSFRSIRGDLDKLTAAAVVCESLDHLTIEHAHGTEDLYELLSLSLDAIELAGDTREVLRACFHALGAILRTTGFYDDRLSTSPSLFQLLALLDQVERAADRKLETREALSQVLEQLRKEKE